MEKKQKTISVSNNTWGLLNQIKYTNNYKTIDETIMSLIKYGIEVEKE